MKWTTSIFDLMNIFDADNDCQRLLDFLETALFLSFLEGFERALNF